jgi:hypothetical protein
MKITILLLGLSLALFGSDTVEEPSFFENLLVWIALLLFLAYIVVGYYNKFKEIIKGGSSSSSSKSEKPLKIVSTRIIGGSTVLVKTTKQSFRIDHIKGIENWTSENIVIRRKTSGSRDAIDTYDAKGSRIDSYLEQ